MIIESGQLFLLSEGEHDYYYPIALCVAIKTIDIEEQQRLWLEKYPEQLEHFKEEQFSRWLLNESGLAVEVNCKEWHLGAYGKIDFSPGAHRTPLGERVND